MRKLFSFCIVLFLTGCDYYGDYHFEIKNEIENKDIQIKIEVNREIEKDTFNLSSFAKERIFTIGSGNIGRNEDPFDRYTEAITVFGVFKLYVDGELIDKDFRKREYWNFQMNGDQSSTYLLKVTQELIDE